MTMTQSEILAIFQKAGAVLTDTHVVTTSGKHGDVYINKDAIYPSTHAISTLCRELAERFAKSAIDAVAGPTIGGVILAQWTAHHLGELQKKPIPALFAEEGENKTRLFKRGYDRFIAGKKILIVEDVMTTGGSVLAVAKAIQALNGKIVGVGALVNRGGVRAADIGGVDITALVELDLTAYDEAECPLCRTGKPINTDVGKGREFLARKSSP